VAHQGGESGQRRALHLEVGDAAPLILERLDFLVQVDVLRFEPHPATLRCVEARGGDGDALARRVAEVLEERPVGIDEVGLRQQFVPAGVAHEGLLDGQVADVVASLVVVEQSVEADRRAREDELPYADVGLQRPRGAQTHECQPLLFALLLAGGEVDVDQRVELRDRDVDVADADTRREDGHALAAVGARHGVEFAVGHLALARVEELGHHGHAARVADQDNGGRNLSGMQMKVENRAVVVDNQFGRWDCSHGSLFFYFYNWHKSNNFTSNNKTINRQILANTYNIF